MLYNTYMVNVYMVHEVLVSDNDQSGSSQMPIKSTNIRETEDITGIRGSWSIGLWHQAFMYSEKRGKLPQNCEDYLKKKKMLKRLKEKCGKSQ